MQISPALARTLDVTAVDHYEIHLLSQTCDCCRSTFQSQTCYEVRLVRSWTTATTKHLRPLKWPSDSKQALWNLPIKRVLGPSQRLPFCFACNEPSLAKWPSVPAPLTHTVADRVIVQAATAKAEAPQAHTAPRQPQPAKAKAKTLAELMDVL